MTTPRQLTLARHVARALEFADIEQATVTDATHTGDGRWEVLLRDEYPPQGGAVYHLVRLTIEEDE